MEVWPGATAKKAFGMVLVYRGEAIFAALPGTRALYEVDAILIKFGRQTPALAKRISADSRFARGPCRIEERRNRERGKSGGYSCFAKTATRGTPKSGWRGPRTQLSSRFKKDPQLNDFAPLAHLHASRCLARRFDPPAAREPGNPERVN